MNNRIIAIDGPAGSGKSTVARAVARELGWVYLDTGSMYRAVAIAARAQGITLTDDEAMGEFAHGSSLSLGLRVLINGTDVTDDLRSERTNHDVSIVATLSSVRKAMVAQQRSFAANADTGVVVEGRDITTVVFPNATVKIYLTATLEERARRRGGDEGVASVARRDDADMTRAVSPLTKADDARSIDTTGRSIGEVVREIVACLENNSN